MSPQATLSQFSRPSPDDDIGIWQLSPDEPGYHPHRRYWRTDDRVLVANQSAGSFAVYDVETWERGILGRGNEPLIDRRDLDDAFDAAISWMLADTGGRSHCSEHDHNGGKRR